MMLKWRDFTTRSASQRAAENNKRLLPEFLNAVFATQTADCAYLL
jgi:hypothetical protein